METLNGPNPDLHARLVWLNQLHRHQQTLAPVRYANTWRCDRTSCDGLPHEGWDFKHARSAQIVDPAWSTFYLSGGRGSGKTWAGGRNLAQLILDTQPDDGDDHTVWAIVAPTFAEAKSVCMEGPSGLLRALGDGTDRSLVRRYYRSIGLLAMTNGAEVYCDSSFDGGRRIQGKNLYGAWCSEVGNWQRWSQTWNESLAWAVRKGPARIIAEGTPRRTSLAKFLLDETRRDNPSVGVRRLLTVDNIPNLDERRIHELEDRYGGTSLGLQELEGILSDEVEGALWSKQLIDGLRIRERVEWLDKKTGRVDITYSTAAGQPWRPPKFWTRTVLAVDPSDGGEKSDEQAMVVVSQSADDHELYVRHSDGGRIPPWPWLEQVADRAIEYGATVIFEKNHGGAYLPSLFHQVLTTKGVTVPYGTVDATKDRSKYTRAELVAGLYQQGRVHHVGDHPELEDQMCGWTGQGNEPSPDRLDALAWALAAWEKTTPGGSRVDTTVPFRMGATSDGLEVTVV